MRLPFDGLANDATTVIDYNIIIVTDLLSYDRDDNSRFPVDINYHTVAKMPRISHRI